MNFRGISILIFISLITLSFSKQTGEGIVSAFLEKYKSDYLIEESSNTFAWILKKNSKYSFTQQYSLKSNQSFKNGYNQLVKQKIEFEYFQYDSEELCQAAFNDLLDNFPTGPTKIRVKENVPVLKIIPSIFIINKKTIIISSVGCDYMNPMWWSQYKDDLVKTFSKSESQIITTECGKNLKWKSSD